VQTCLHILKIRTSGGFPLDERVGFLLFAGTTLSAAYFVLNSPWCKSGYVKQKLKRSTGKVRRMRAWR
jgi:hypothetical protein